MTRPQNANDDIPEHEDKTYDDRKQGYYVVGKVNSWVLIVKIRDDESEYCNGQNRTNYWPYNLKDVNSHRHSLFSSILTLPSERGYLII
jgi:hypothetical protein